MVPNKFREKIEIINSYKFRSLIYKLLKECAVCHTTLVEKFLNNNQLCENCRELYKSNIKNLNYVFKELGLDTNHKDVAQNLKNYKAGLNRFLSVILKWGLKYPMIIPLTVKWEATNACNLNCQHCLVNSKKPNSNELTTNEVFHMIDQCDLIGVKNFGILGGEPFLRKDIFEIIKYLETKKFDISISTNGTLVDEKIAEMLSHQKINAIVISIDGLEQVHDTFRGKKGAFKATELAIRYLNQKKIKVGIT